MTTLDLLTREDLDNFKKELFEELRRLKIDHTDKASKKWLKSSDVRKLLCISPGTLQTLRNGTLRFTKVGNILYYKNEDLTKSLKKT